MSHLSAVNLATGWLGVSTHALLLRPSNHIYVAAAALSQSKVHDVDRPNPSAALTVVQPAEYEWWPQTTHKLATTGSYAVHSEMLRTEKGRRKGTELIDWVGFNVPLNTLQVISGTGLYGSNDPTNSVKALKEVVVLRTGFKPTRSTSPCYKLTHAYNTQ